MKKSLLALAVLGAFAGSAVAQSSVTLYGVADANFTSAKGYNAAGQSQRLSSIGSGGLQGSRWGLRGTEDLGGGARATFNLESGFSIDNGSSLQGSRLFGRHSWVGVGWAAGGDIRLGRTLTPIGVATDELGPMSTKGADIMAVAQTLGAVAAYRTDNAITYVSPNWGGFSTQVQYSLRNDGAEQNKPNEKFGRHFGFNAMFKNKMFLAGVGYLNIQDLNSTLVGNQKATGLLAFGGLDLGFAAFKLAYNRDERKDLGYSKKPTTIAGSVEAPLGPVTLAAAYGINKDVTGASGSVKDDADIVTLQAVYNLSKRTALYTFYTWVDNEAATGGQSRGFNSPAQNKSSDQLQIGIRHRF
ncbi:MAG: porin [Rhizobacter sp.]